MSGTAGFNHGYGNFLSLVTVRTGAGGGGSGGSIWIDCNTLSGSGFIKADGGAGGKDGGST